MKKEKLLVTSNFSFFHSVFKGIVLQTRKNQDLLAKGLRPWTKCKYANGPCPVKKKKDLQKLLTQVSLWESAQVDFGQNF